MRKILVVYGLFIVGAVGVAFYRWEVTPYQQDKAACEARGRFYWRGNCLPSECSVVRP